MSLYRKTVWFYKGWNEYTKNGYKAASKNFVNDDLDVDCKGKVYLITGANSGIGKCVAAAVAGRGGTVHMVCRNAERAEDAKQEIIQGIKDADVHVHILDLSNPRAVSQFAKQFAQSHERLDVLVNNAGCMVPRAVDGDGVETNFATNSLTPHTLTLLLRPLLHRSSEPRVVTVSSGGMLTQRLDLDDVQSLKREPFDATMAYAQQKRQQVILTEMYAAEDEKVFYAAMHPGWADTPAVRSAMPDFYAKMKDRLRTAEEGADTAVWLAVAKRAVDNKSGLFYQDRQPVSAHLPLACTRSSDEENTKLKSLLDDFVKRFSSDS